MKYGLTAYGTVYYMGIHPETNRDRITAVELMNMAESYGLQGIEVPYDILKSGDPDEAAECARKKGMFINIAAAGFDPAGLKEAMQLAQRVGALTVRTVVGGAKLGGDRRHMAGSWKPFLETITRSLQEVVDSAERTAPILRSKIIRTWPRKNCFGCAKASVPGSSGLRSTRETLWRRLKSRWTSFAGLHLL